MNEPTPAQQTLLDQLPPGQRNARFNQAQWGFLIRAQSYGYTALASSVDPEILIVRRDPVKYPDDRHLTVSKTPAGFGLVVRLPTHMGTQVITQREAEAILAEGSL